MTGAEPRPRRRDRAVVFVARMLARAFYRSVEVAGEPPHGGRVILAASHLNGFVDPVLLVARLGPSSTGPAPRPTARTPDAAAAAELATLVNRVYDYVYAGYGTGVLLVQRG
jgi:hypothetical protein